jgi:hypothetical protein
MQSDALPSEQVVLASPMSFAGSTRRIWRRWHPRALSADGWGKTAYWTLLITLLVLAVLAWHCVFVVLFGFLFIPYQIVRRVQRRGRRNELRHREMMALLNAQQPQDVPSAPPAAAPGWYPDQNDPSRVRYFDGRVWTSSTQPRAEWFSAPAGRPISVHIFAHIGGGKRNDVG